MSQHLVIIGGGFAGINLAKKMCGDKAYHITLIDKNNYNFFTPLIYQVGTGYLDPSSITYPFRNLFRKKENVRFRLGEFEKVDLTNKKVILNNGEVAYDHLIIATGTHTNFFGNKSIEEKAIPMKTLEDALEMRNLLLQRLEYATRLKNKQERIPWLNMVIAGGGASGVEISGIFAELKNQTIRKEFPELVDSGANIYLVNSRGELLTPMSKESQSYTLEKLTQMGVKVILNTRVSGFDGEVVQLSNGSQIESKNLIWATGVIGFKFEGFPNESYGPGHRLKVNDFNMVEGVDHVYALGDACFMLSDPQFTYGHPQLAQVAIQQGKLLAANLKRMAKGDSLKAFRYVDKGSMAIIGVNKAVADLPKIHFNGVFAWFLWIFVHILSLINYRNRWRTFYNWSIEYLTKNQDLRLIIRPKDKID
ncbi:NAD(P)/FAD-dependent oxidoreductase [Aegicerativicinus sediminis]|uniref:NAD(P)/FAD-dependent oxidoreductase n=1 Tax=Aegicerativicinus sediminis TaxID=2893202 RepID=UPI001E3DDE23|nr:NAD(P)/FAD-dependent oxidoreductase [Aegicerativicinus sediminis]